MRQEAGPRKRVAGVAFVGRLGNVLVEIGRHGPSHVGTVRKLEMIIRDGVAVGVRGGVPLEHDIRAVALAAVGRIDGRCGRFGRACLRPFDPGVRDPQVPGGICAGFVVRVLQVRETVVSHGHGRHGQRRHLDVVLDVDGAQRSLARQGASEPVLARRRLCGL